MASGIDGKYSTGCGIGTLLDVSYQGPESILRGQFVSRRVFINGGYSQIACFGSGYKWIHVYFSDYDRTHEPDRSGYKSVSSGAKFAAYIEANNLGTITRSPAIPNPAHPERPAGEGDVTAYVWTLDNQGGITAWATKLGLIPNPTGTHLGVQPIQQKGT